MEIIEGNGFSLITLRRPFDIEKQFELNKQREKHRRSAQNKKQKRNKKQEMIMIAANIPGNKGSRDVDYLLEYIEGPSKNNKKSKNKTSKSMNNNNNNESITSKPNTTDEKDIESEQSEEEDIEDNEVGADFRDKGVKNDIINEEVNFKCSGMEGLYDELGIAVDGHQVVDVNDFTVVQKKKNPRKIDNSKGDPVPNPIKKMEGIRNKPETILYDDSLESDYQNTNFSDFHKNSKHDKESIMVGLPYPRDKFNPMNNTFPNDFSGISYCDNTELGRPMPLTSTNQGCRSAKSESTKDSNISKDKRKKKTSKKKSPGACNKGLQPPRFSGGNVNEAGNSLTVPLPSDRLFPKKSEFAHLVSVKPTGKISNTEQLKAPTLYQTGSLGKSGHNILEEID